MFCGAVGVTWVNSECESYHVRVGALSTQYSEECKLTKGDRRVAGIQSWTWRFWEELLEVCRCWRGAGIAIDPGPKEDTTKIGEILTCVRHHGIDTEDMKGLLGQHQKQIIWKFDGMWKTRELILICQNNNWQSDKWPYRQQEIKKWVERPKDCDKVRFVGDSRKKNNIQIFWLEDFASQGQGDAQDVAENFITDLITIEIMMWDADWVVKLGMNRGCWSISMRFKTFVKKLEMLQHTNAIAAGLREKIVGCSVADTGAG